MSGGPAVVWELVCSSGGVGRVGFVVVGEFLLVRVADAGRVRGSWSVERVPGGADRRAVSLTGFVEEQYGGVLVALPGVVAVRAGEVEELAGGRVPEGLRRRVSGSLRRAAAAAAAGGG